MTYPEYPSSTKELEEGILERWREEDLFNETLRATAKGDEFVFFEGPPTANGRPGIHHVISRAIKDLVCRYQTMQGRHVTRIAGWDTHGLPVEIEAEKKLGISGKKQIEEIGVARFNEVCRDSVFTYKEEWERLSERIGYWLDYSEPYVTYTRDYIESVWAIFGEFAKKDLIYRGHKSVPYCPRCETALSSHEVAQGYKDVSDPSIYFLAPLLRPHGGRDDDNRAFLVWTTTPWTIPANAALAVRPDLLYVEVEWENWRLIVAEERVVPLFGEDAKTGRSYAAAELIGQAYERPFDLLGQPVGGENGWRVVGEDFVSSTDGTGIVHIAPAFGADDYAAGQRHYLPMLQPLDDSGRFDDQVPLVGGRFVKDADPLLIDDLKSRGMVYEVTSEVHSYPHCWRCSSPLIYMARASWYLRTTAVRDQMIQNNVKVEWHPQEVGTGRFGEWLEGNVDWAISRERYWGTPLPIWVCDNDDSHMDVIGSFEHLRRHTPELAEDFDPHKPFIDEVTWPCVTCSGTMRRTPEVIDVWFDSGSMPYAQWHYPFENEKQFERHFPADFICEGVDQTRGWFYSLMAISTMLGKGPAYRNVVVNDLILDSEGQKMSKSKGNTVDPWHAIEQFGADAIRWYLLTVSQPWVPKRFDPEALSDSARRTFDRMVNTYRFFAMYANLEGWRPSDVDPHPRQRPVLDRWMLARLSRLAETVRKDLDAYEVTRASRAIGDFIGDDLSNWYVRRSRSRFWGSADLPDSRAAFTTLHEALVTIAQLLAPMTPFQADWLHRALTGTSVHLAEFPKRDRARENQALESGMDAVRELVRLGRAARERMKTGVRQPLQTMYAVTPGRIELDGELLDVLSDELNVKEIRFLAGAEDLVTLRATPNFRVLGKRFGPRTPMVADAVRRATHEQLQAYRGAGTLTLDIEGESVEVAGEELELVEEARGEFVVEAAEGYTVALDPTIDDELRREGLARELVNRIQRLRRDLGFEVSDRIALAIAGDAEVIAAVAAHSDYISGETLAVELKVGSEAIAERASHEVDLEPRTARIALEVVAGRA